jgi:hypothetical protein
MKLYKFRTVPLYIIRSFSLCTQQWYMSYRLRVVSKPVWHIPLLCVQWKTPDDRKRNCPKHVEFHSKNKLEKLVHLVGFIIRNILNTRFNTANTATVTEAAYRQIIRENDHKLWVSIRVVEWGECRQFYPFDPSVSINLLTPEFYI